MLLTIFQYPTANPTLANTALQPCIRFAAYYGQEAAQELTVPNSPLSVSCRILLGSLNRVSYRPSRLMTFLMRSVMPARSSMLATARLASCCTCCSTLRLFSRVLTESQCIPWERLVMSWACLTPHSEGETLTGLSHSERDPQTRAGASKSTSSPGYGLSCGALNGAEGPSRYKAVCCLIQHECHCPVYSVLGSCQCDVK